MRVGKSANSHCVSRGIFCDLQPYSLALEYATELSMWDENHCGVEDNDKERLALLDYQKSKVFISYSKWCFHIHREQLKV